MGFVYNGVYWSLGGRVWNLTCRESWTELTYDPDDRVYILDRASPRRALMAVLMFGRTEDLHQSIAFIVRWVFRFDRRLDPEEDKLTDRLRHVGDTVAFYNLHRVKRIALRGLM